MALCGCWLLTQKMTRGKKKKKKPIQPTQQLLPLVQLLNDSWPQTAKAVSKITSKPTRAITGRLGNDLVRKFTLAVSLFAWQQQDPVQVDGGQARRPPTPPAWCIFLCEHRAGDGTGLVLGCSGMPLDPWPPFYDSHRALWSSSRMRQRPGAATII